MTYVILTCLVIFAIGPIVLFFFNALKTTDQYAANALNPPTTWQWSNFVTAWTQANMGAGLWNSVVIVLGTVVLTCIVAGCAAYALARLEIKGHAVFITYLLVASSLPTQMFLVPLFYMWTKAGLYDSRFGLVLIYCGLFSPFEAARVDGAGEVKVLLRIILPNALPGLLTIALTTGLSAYNEFLFAVTFIQNSKLLPLSTTFFAFQQGYTQNYNLVSAAGVIMIAPMLLLFLFLQRRFIDGLSSSGLGGT